MKDGLGLCFLLLLAAWAGCFGPDGDGRQLAWGGQGAEASIGTYELRPGSSRPAELTGWARIESVQGDGRSIRLEGTIHGSQLAVVGLLRSEDVAGGRCLAGLGDARQSLAPHKIWVGEVTANWSSPESAEPFGDLVDWCAAFAETRDAPNCTSHGIVLFSPLGRAANELVVVTALYESGPPGPTGQESQWWLFTSPDDDGTAFLGINVTSRTGGYVDFSFRFMTPNGDVVATERIQGVLGDGNSVGGGRLSTRTSFPVTELGDYVVGIDGGVLGSGVFIDIIGSVSLGGQLGMVFNLHDGEEC